jgi:hypothetical protein
MNKDKRKVLHLQGVMKYGRITNELSSGDPDTDVFKALSYWVLVNWFIDANEEEFEDYLEASLEEPLDPLLEGKSEEEQIYMIVSAFNGHMNEKFEPFMEFNGNNACKVAADMINDGLIQKFDICQN